MMAEEAPDLVISDIEMAGMDGSAFLKAVREPFPHLPEILMMDYATGETAVAVLRGRAYDYLKKPVRLVELRACIERVDMIKRVYDQGAMALVEGPSAVLKSTNPN